MSDDERPEPSPAAADEPKRKPRPLWWRLVRSCLRIVILAYVGLAAVLWIFQSRFIYQPRKGFSQTPKVFGLDYEEVSFEADDGVSLSAWFVPAKGPSKVVLFCHGNGGNISDRCYSLNVFNRLGLAVLIFDYRGYGKSEGSPSEEGIARDARAAWEYLVDERGYAAGDIIIFGRSLGGAVAARLAHERTPAALILESTFTSVPNVASDLYPFLPVRPLCRFSYDSLSIVGDIACPVLIAHSKDDELMPYSHSRALFEAASEPKEFLELSGGHNDGITRSGMAYTDGLRHFLDKHVKTSPLP